MPATNLRYLFTTKLRQAAPGHRKIVPTSVNQDRMEWLTRNALKYYPKWMIEQVLTNRRSDFSDEALIEDFKRTEQPEHHLQRDYHYRRALRVVRERFKPNRALHPVSYPDLRYYPWTLNVSAETPWTNENYKFVPQYRDIDMESGVPKVHRKTFERMPYADGAIPVHHYLKMKQKLGLIENSNTTFHNLYNEIFIYNRTRIHQIKDGNPPFWDENGNPKPYYWNTVHARSHVVAKDEPDKIRAVFGSSKLLLQAELMFIWPLQATYLTTDTGDMLWNRETSRGGWKRLFKEMHENGPLNTVLSVDWSQFDKRLLHELIDDVHDIWRSYFNFDRYEPTSVYPKAKTNPERIERLWRWMTNAIKSTPIHLPNQEVWEWTRNGFGSGFQQTQLMDSFANAVMILTCLSSLGINIESDEFWCKFQGDDSLIGFKERMFQIYGQHFLDKLAEEAARRFNAKLNAKKSGISDRVTGTTILSYGNSHGIPHRAEEDLLRHLFFPERPQDYARLAASAMGLAMAAGGEYPRFHDLCTKVFNHITKEWDLQPKWSTLKWMIRAGLYETLDQLAHAEVPSRLTLLSQVYVYQPKPESMTHRQWPRKPGPRGRFFFLLDV